MEINFIKRARRNDERLYLVINDKEIINGTWEQLNRYLPAVSGLNNTIINDIANYGDCMFSYGSTSFRITNNETFYKYIEIIHNKEVKLIAEYFSEHKIVIL